MELLTHRSATCARAHVDICRCAWTNCRNTHVYVDDRARREFGLRSVAVPFSLTSVFSCSPFQHTKKEKPTKVTRHPSLGQGAPRVVSPATSFLPSSSLLLMCVSSLVLRVSALESAAAMLRKTSGSFLLHPSSSGDTHSSHPWWPWPQADIFLVLAFLLPFALALPRCREVMVAALRPMLAGKVTRPRSASFLFVFDSSKGWNNEARGGSKLDCTDGTTPFPFPPPSPSSPSSVKKKNSEAKYIRFCCRCR